MSAPKDTTTDPAQIRAAMARATSGIEWWDDGFEIVGDHDDSDNRVAWVPGAYTLDQIVALTGAPLDLITDNRGWKA